MRAGLALALAWGAAGCVIPVLDTTGRACPCSPGFVCDDGVCAPCTVGEGREDPGAAVHVAGLKGAFATPNQVRWGWTPSGDSSQLRSYSLVLGRTEADVRGCTGSAELWTAKRNPELGAYFLPRTMVQDPVAATTTDLLDAGTEYFAKLVAADTSGNLSVSNIAGQRTGDPPLHEELLLGDDCPQPQPQGFRPTSAAHGGDAGWAYTLECTGTDCFQNVTCNYPGAGVPLRDLTLGRFTNAFLEVAVADESTVPSYWSNLGLAFGQPCGVFACHFFFEAWTLPATGRYRVMQVPLRVMVGFDGGTLALGDIDAGVSELMFGAGGPPGAVLHIDEARIKY